MKLWNIWENVSEVKFYDIETLLALAYLRFSRQSNFLQRKRRETLY